MPDAATSKLRSPSKRRQRLFKFALVLGSLFCGLLLVEAGLRIIGYSFPNFYIRNDFERGIVLRPGAQGWFRKENVNFVTINSVGLRDREHQIAKPPGVFRIAVLGDSYAEALQVKQDEAFWHVLEQQLRGCSDFDGRQIEVINFGVSGYGTAQELITLRTQVWQYAPDLVLLAVTLYNDISDNSKQLKGTGQIPYFLLRDGQLVLDDSFRRALPFRNDASAAFATIEGWAYRIRIFQLINHAAFAWRTYRRNRRAQAEKKTDVESPPSTPPPSDDSQTWVLAPRDELWSEAWRVTEALMRTMNDEVRAHGAKFYVVTLSAGIQVHPNPVARAKFMQRVGAEDIFYPDHRIADLGKQTGFPVLNLAPAFQAYAERTGTYLHGFDAELGNGHWNAAGHRLAGEMIAAHICRTIAETAAPDVQK